MVDEIRGMEYNNDELVVYLSENRVFKTRNHRVLNDLCQHIPNTYQNLVLLDLHYDKSSDECYPTEYPIVAWRIKQGCMEPVTFIEDVVPIPGEGDYKSQNTAIFNKTTGKCYSYDAEFDTVDAFIEGSLSNFREFNKPRP